MKRGEIESHAVLWGWLIVMGVIGGVAAFPPKDSGDVASWVQGVGTIAAMAVAAWVGLLPLRQEAERVAADRMTRLASVMAAFAFLVGGARAFRQAVAERDHDALSNALVSLRETNPVRIFEKLLAEPLAYWPSPLLYVQASAIVQQFPEVLDRAGYVVRAGAHSDKVRREGYIIGDQVVADRMLSRNWASLDSAVEILDFSCDAASEEIARLQLGAR